MPDLRHAQRFVAADALDGGDWGKNEALVATMFVALATEKHPEIVASLARDLRDIEDEGLMIHAANHNPNDGNRFYTAQALMRMPA